MLAIGRWRALLFVLIGEAARELSQALLAKNFRWLGGAVAASNVSRFD